MSGDVARETGLSMGGSVEPAAIRDVPLPVVADASFLLVTDVRGRVFWDTWPLDRNAGVIRGSTL